MERIPLGAVQRCQREGRTRASVPRHFCCRTLAERHSNGERAGVSRPCQRACYGAALRAWVRARQERAEADVKRRWERDPLVLLETKGTLEGPPLRSRFRI